MIILLVMICGCSSRTCFVSSFLTTEKCPPASSCYTDMIFIRSWYAQKNPKLLPILPGYYRVVMFRPKRFYGSAVEAWMSIKDGGVISIGNGGCIVWEEPAGLCEIKQYYYDFIKPLSFQAQESKTYYIDLNLERNEMILLDSSIGQEWLSKYTPITNPSPNEWRRDWSRK